MIGIVVVSHSRALAEAAVELASQMAPDGGPTVVFAGGAAGGLGTDATEVAEALSAAASPDGVLVLMDLGSAIMSAELAVELAGLDDVAVRLSAAPVVEGLVAAVVRAAGGADLDTVAREAEQALRPKREALGGPAPEGQQNQESVAPDPDGASIVLTLVNPVGLHARPAAQLAAALGQLDAEVVVSSHGRHADGASSLEMLTLGAGKGDEITVSATGAEAQRALDTTREMVVKGFGELGPPGD